MVLPLQILVPLCLSTVHVIKIRAFCMQLTIQFDAWCLSADQELVVSQNEAMMILMYLDCFAADKLATRVGQLPHDVCQVVTLLVLQHHSSISNCSTFWVGAQHLTMGAICSSPCVSEPEQLDGSPAPSEPPETSTQLQTPLPVRKCYSTGPTPPARCLQVHTVGQCLCNGRAPLTVAGPFT